MIWGRLRAPLFFRHDRRRPRRECNEFAGFLRPAEPSEWRPFGHDGEIETFSFCSVHGRRFDRAWRDRVAADVFRPMLDHDHHGEIYHARLGCRIRRHIGDARKTCVRRIVDDVAAAMRPESRDLVTDAIPGADQIDAQHRDWFRRSLRRSAYEISRCRCRRNTAARQLAKGHGGAHQGIETRADLQDLRRAPSLFS